MNKILELKGEDFSKGISAQGNIPIGGLFQQFKGVDPFYNQGLAVPYLVPAQITPSTAPKFIVNFNTGGVEYLYWLSSTEVKQALRESPYTQTDKTSSVTIATSIIGSIIWKGKLIYSTKNNDLRSNTIPIAIGTDVQIKGAFNYTANTYDSMPFCVGADGNLYHGDQSRIGIITSATGTAGNSGFFNVDDGFYVRDIINNGRYLVILADDNIGTLADRRIGNYRCRVYFWDMIKATADVIFDIDDSYLIAGEQLDNNIYFFGYNGMYVCNESTSPKMIRPFVSYNGTSRAKPFSPYHLVRSKGSIYWVDGSNNVLYNGNVYAYGNPTNGLTKIFYQPHLNSNAGQTNAQNVIAVVGEQFWTADASPKIYVQNTGTTNGVMTITTLDKVFPQPYRFDLVKVVLSSPLTTGQSVSCSVTGANGSKTISNVETKSYSATNPRQNLIFKTNPSAGSESKFEDMRVTIESTGATIQRISVYATPLDDITETL
jgi:hypothetical protein